MQQFLDDFAATIGEDEYVVIVLDQAGWLHLRARFLSHRPLNDYDAMVDATCTAWNRLCDVAGRITSLASYPWVLKIKP